MNIETTIKNLAAIRDEIKAAVTEGEHIFEQLVKTGDRITPFTIPTGQLPTAVGAITMAITSLEGHLQKAAEIQANNKKLESAPSA